MATLASLPKYSPRPAHLQQWLKLMRPHQTEALSALKGVDVGRVCMPTGTGKTRVQVALHIAKMLELEAQGLRGVFVIVSPRRVLNAQLMDEATSILIQSGILFDTINVASSVFDHTALHKKYKALGFNGKYHRHKDSTQASDIYESYRYAKHLGRHLLITCTYNSFDRLEQIPIDCCTFDEAHFSISKQFAQRISVVLPNIKTRVFFTATPKAIGQHGGMNDEKLYGPVICDVLPRTMIKRGEMVGPVIHKVYTAEEGDFDNDLMVERVVVKAYDSHSKTIKAQSFDPSKIAAKMLVAMSGLTQMAQVSTSESVRAYVAECDIDIAMISSQDCSWNFVLGPREWVMENIRSMGDDRGGIVLHVDTLAEGIDVPGFTGALLLRPMGTSKMIQTVGRTTRLHQHDRARLHSGEIMPDQKDMFVKPNCHIIVPTFLGDEDQTDFIKMVFREYINYFQSKPEIVELPEQFLAPQNLPLRSILKYNTPATGDECDLVHILEEVMLENDINVLMQELGINAVINFDRLDVASQVNFLSEWCDKLSQLESKNGDSQEQSNSFIPR